MRSTRSTSGWSARGGLTKNPLCARSQYQRLQFRVGCGHRGKPGHDCEWAPETDGSIISPCNVNGLVGIKPTLGLVSRTGIIPIAHSQDTAGPMARTVSDAALLLTILAGTDAEDAETQAADGKRSDFLTALDKDALKGARLGVVKSQFGGRNDLASAVVEKGTGGAAPMRRSADRCPQLPNAKQTRRARIRVLFTQN